MAIHATRTFVLGLLVSLSPCLLAAGYEQKQGNAVVRLQADMVEAGQVEIRLSDELVVTMSVEGRSTLEVEPVQTLTPSPDWQVNQKSDAQRVPLAGGRIRWEQSFHLTPVKPGEVPLPLAPLRFREEQDLASWKKVDWQPIPVRITTEIQTVDLSELRDIPGPEEMAEPSSWWMPLSWIALALGSLALFVGGFEFLRRRARRKVVVLPHEWALCELARIANLTPSAESEVERFHTLLSDVIRKYLELRFHLPAPEQTTAEFLEGMHRSAELTTAQQDALRDFMKRCDLVKFARANASPEECQTLAASAREFVEQSRPARRDRMEIGLPARN